MGALTTNYCLYIWGMALERAGAISWAAPLFDTLYRSILAVHIGGMSWEWGPLGGELPECSNKILLFFYT
jgi:hypothetical protein